MIDFAAIRSGMTSLPTDHDASGTYRPTVDEIFTPAQHANALDPNTPVVVGARGAGKSFWAGVLEGDETRAATALAYPMLGLDRLIVKFGYTGLAGDDTPSSKTIESRVPKGRETDLAYQFWQSVIIKTAETALDPTHQIAIREVMAEYTDPEDAESRMRSLDASFAKMDRTLLITFDALDTLSRDWVRSSLLVDALFEVIWTLRARRFIRAKVFIRPEQLNDENLKFVEMPKLRSGRVELEWGQTDLYGLLFWQLARSAEASSAATALQSIAQQINAPIQLDLVQRRKHWRLLRNAVAQKRLMTLFAGQYMGATSRKGGTYDWSYKHLADAAGKVTPRSFLTLFRQAAMFGKVPTNQVISAEGIRHGLKEASKVRVEQLQIEYPWIKRALLPLAGVVVPCEQEQIFGRWRDSNTVRLILEAAGDPEEGFLPPFPLPSKGDHLELLASAMQKISVLYSRDDGRMDIPDLFRVAARMLKKGGISPKQKK